MRNFNREFYGRYSTPSVKKQLFIYLNFAIKNLEERFNRGILLGNCQQDL